VPALAVMLKAAPPADASVKVAPASMMNRAPFVQQQRIAGKAADAAGAVQFEGPDHRGVKVSLLASKKAAEPLTSGWCRCRFACAGEGRALASVQRAGAAQRPAGLRQAVDVSETAPSAMLAGSRNQS